MLMSEFFSMRVKGAAQSLVTAVMFAGGALADLVFLLLHRRLGSFSYLVFGGVAGFGALFVFLFLPQHARPRRSTKKPTSSTGSK